MAFQVPPLGSFMGNPAPQLDAQRSRMISENTHLVFQPQQPDIDASTMRLPNYYRTSMYMTQQEEILQNHRIGYKYVQDRSQPESNPAESIHTAPVPQSLQDRIARPDQPPRIYGM